MKDNEINLPIGFFDSGVGGIAVLKQAISLMPYENYIYYGDSGNLPYGNKTESEIKALSLTCGEILYNRGVKAIVMACNTATSIAVQMMRDKYKIPVISIEPAVKPAIEALKDGYVIVMATPATIHQERYNMLLSRIGHRDRIINIPCSRLAKMIEKLDLDSPAIKHYVREKLMPFQNREIDGIVMGCTHYSFISGLIQNTAKDLFSGKCEIFDGKFGMARQLKKVLEDKGILNTENKNPAISLYTSGTEHDIELYKKFISF